MERRRAGIRGSALGALVLVVATGSLAASVSPDERFLEAGELVRGGDALKGIAIYRELASSSIESASLYWNWSQAASTRGRSARRCGPRCEPASSTRETAPFRGRSSGFERRPISIRRRSPPSLWRRWLGAAGASISTGSHWGWRGSP